MAARKLYLIDDGKVGSNDTIGLLDAIENAIQQYGVRIILLDNLMIALSTMAEKSSEKYEQQSQFIKRLIQITKKYNVLIILVAHKRKNGFGGDEMDDVSGSSDIVNLASVVISYGRDREIPDNQRKLRLLKNRLFGKVNFDGWIMNFDDKSNRIYGDKDNKDYEMGWTKALVSDFVPADDEEIPFI